MIIGRSEEQPNWLSVAEVKAIIKQYRPVYNEFEPVIGAVYGLFTSIIAFGINAYYENQYEKCHKYASWLCVGSGELTLMGYCIYKAIVKRYGYENCKQILNQCSNDQAISPQHLAQVLQNCDQLSHKAICKKLTPAQMTVLKISHNAPVASLATKEHQA